jgi:hypothetical protein
MACPPLAEPATDGDAAARPDALLRLSYPGCLREATHMARMRVRRQAGRMTSWVSVSFMDSSVRFVARVRRHCPHAAEADRRWRDKLAPSLEHAAGTDETAACALASGGPRFIGPGTKLGSFCQPATSNGLIAWPSTYQQVWSTPRTRGQL